MKKYFYTIVTTLLILTSCSTATTSEQKDIAIAIERQIKNYPHSTLQDIYKSFFQDYFGVAHMLPDSVTVRNYILYELSMTEEIDSNYYEPCGWRNNFYRVNLSAIRNGKIDVNELANAFMASLPYSRTLVDEEWKKEWEIIQNTVRELHPTLAGFKSDSAMIAKMLQQGKYVIHHSDEYSRCYHPHYRIVHKSIFKNKILPLLEQ